MFATLVRVILCSAVVAIFSATAYASPYRADAFFDTSRINAERTRFADSGDDYQAISPIVVTTKIHGVGNVRVTFNRRQIKNWLATVKTASGEKLDTVDPVLLEGKILFGHASFSQGGRSVPTAGAIINGELRINFVRSARGGHKRYYTLKVPLSGKNRTIRVSSVPESFARARSCGLEGQQAQSGTAEKLHNDTPVTTSAVTRQIDMATQYDASWFGLYGANSNAEIAVIINSANVIYQRDLGTRIRIVSQTGSSSSSIYSSTNASTLLTQFRTDTSRDVYRSSSDVQFFFTGRDLDGSTIGIAYVGAAANFGNQYAYGLMQHYTQSLNANILAHELGHLLNLQHTGVDVNDLMYPSVNGASFFASSTVAIAIAYMDSRGSEFAYDGASGDPAPEPTATPTAVPTVSPTSTPTDNNPAPPPPSGNPSDPTDRAPEIVWIGKRVSKVFFERAEAKKTAYRKIVVRGAIVDAEADESYGGTEISFEINGESAEGTVTTDDEGFFRAEFTVPGKSKISVQSFATIDGEKLSSTLIKFKKAASAKRR